MLWCITRRVVWSLSIGSTLTNQHWHTLVKMKHWKKKWHHKTQWSHRIRDHQRNIEGRNSHAACQHWPVWSKSSLYVGKCALCYSGPSACDICGQCREGGSMCRQWLTLAYLHVKDFLALQWRRASSKIRRCQYTVMKIKPSQENCRGTILHNIYLVSEASF